MSLANRALVIMLTISMTLMVPLPPSQAQDGEPPLEEDRGPPIEEDSLFLDEPIFEDLPRIDPELKLDDRLDINLPRLDPDVKLPRVEACGVEAPFLLGLTEANVSVNQEILPNIIQHPGDDLPIDDLPIDPGAPELEEPEIKIGGDQEREGMDPGAFPPPINPESIESPKCQVDIPVPSNELGSTYLELPTVNIDGLDIGNPEQIGDPNDFESPVDPNETVSPIDPDEVVIPIDPDQIGLPDDPEIVINPDDIRLPPWVGLPGEAVDITPIDTDPLGYRVGSIIDASELSRLDDGRDPETTVNPDTIKPAFFYVTGTGSPPAVGIPTQFYVEFNARTLLENVRIQIDTPASVLPGLNLDTAWDSVPEGAHETRILSVTPQGAGEHEVTFRLTGTSEWGDFERISRHRIQIGDDYARVLPLAEEVPLPEGMDSMSMSTTPYPMFPDLTSSAGARPQAAPIVFTHGYDPSGPPGRNVDNAFNNIMNALDAWGWNDNRMYPLAFYMCDSTTQGLYTDYYGSPGVSDKHNDHLMHDASYSEAHQGTSSCTSPAGTTHTRGTSIQHLGYHWAWSVYNAFQSGDSSLMVVPEPVCVRAVSYSMGGLITRYALAQVGVDADFPPRLCIQDIVTLGTPHDGTWLGGPCHFDQCDQQTPWSNFIDNWMRTNAAHPDGTGRTDWTALGSEDDPTVDEHSAADDNLQADHFVIYDESDGVEHSGVNGFINGQNHMGNGNTYSSDLDGEGGWIDGNNVDYPSPGRVTDMSLAYEKWACGTFAKPPELKLNTPVVGEPLTTSYNCHAAIKFSSIPSGTSQLVFQLTTPSGKARVLDVYRQVSSSTYSYVCASSATANPECRINTPACCNYIVRVRNLAAGTDPFVLTISLRSGTHDLSSTAVTGLPASVKPGEQYQACWSVWGSGSISDTWTEWDTSASGSYPNDGTHRTGYTADANFCQTFQAPLGTSGGVHMRSRALGPNDNLVSPVKFITLDQSEDDCGLGKDALGSYYTTDTIYPDVTCEGGFHKSSDNHDFYRMYVAAGKQIQVTLKDDLDANFDLYLYRSGPTMVASSTSSTGTDSVSYTTTSTGWYTIQIYRVSQYGLYEMSVKVTTAQNDCGTGGDASNTLSGANAIPISGSYCSGKLPSGDTYDIYRIYPGSGSAFKVTLVPGTSGFDPDLHIYNPSNSHIGSSTSTGTDQVTISGTSAGWYKILVHRYSGYGTYHLKPETVASGPPQNDCGTGGDASDSYSSASTITPSGSWCSGQFPSGDNFDYYRFYVPTGYAINGWLSGSGTDFDLYLYNTGGSLVDSSTSGSSSEHVTHTATSSGYHILLVHRYSGYGSYAMKVTTSAASQDDCNTGGDASNSLGSATTVSASSSWCLGELISGDNFDYYRVYVGANKKITWSMLDSSGYDFDIYLYSPSNSYLTSSATSSNSEQVTYLTGSTSGYYKLLVYRYSGYGDYYVKFQVDSAQNDCGTGGDAGNSLGSASTIAVTGSYCYGSLESGDNYDYYRFYVGTGQQLTVTMIDTSSRDYDIYLYSPSNSYITSSATGSDTEQVTTNTGSTSGYYKVLVYRYSGYGQYALKVAAVAGQNDCGTGGDAGNSLGAASTIGLSSAWCTGKFVSGDNYDYYRFYVPSYTNLDLRMVDSSSADFDIYLYNPSNSYISSSTSSSNTDQITYNSGSTSGYYKLLVYRYSGYGSYNLRVYGSSAPSQNDCGTGGDASNYYSSATTIATSSSYCSGQLPSGDNYDYYRFYVSSYKNLEIKLVDGSSTDFDIALYNPGGSYVGGSSTSSNTETINYYTGSASGYYTARVSKWSGNGYYNFRASVSSGSSGDCNTGADAGNYYSSASTITPSASWCSGTMPGGDYNDWYRFYVGTGTTISVTMVDGSSGDFDIYLYDPSVNYKTGSASYSNTESFSYYTGGTSGYYLLRLYQYSGSGGYSLKVTT